MNTRRAVAAVAIAAVAGAAIVTVFFPGLLIGDPGSYDETTVTITDEDGTELGTVDVRIADTRSKRYTGLSDTDSLASDEGMLFVHDKEDQHSYVMRDMSFPLDIIFVDANGTIVQVFHARIDGKNAPYKARGKYVLETNRGWANQTGVSTGDTVEIPDSMA
jgi:uncharacterized membrane protein (UPF0127 family)